MSEGTQEQRAMPKWAVGALCTVVGALAVGAITQGVMIYAQMQVVGVQMASMGKSIDELKGRFDELQGMAGDRWTRTDHSGYAEKLDAKFEATKAEASREVAALRAELMQLEARLEKHQDGHPFNVRELVRSVEARVSNLEYQAGVKKQ